MTVKTGRISALKAIKSPVRTRIVEALLPGAPLSVAQIAERMNASPVALYHHVKILVAAGIVKPAGMAGEGRAAERLYTLVARGFRVETANLKPKDRGDLADLGAAHVRYALRRYSRAVTAGDAVLDGPGRTALVRHMILRLTDAQLKKLNEEIDRLVQNWALTPGQREQGERQVSLALVMGPSER